MEESSTSVPPVVALCRKCGERPRRKDRRLCTQCRHQQYVERGQKDSAKRRAQKDERNARARERHAENPEKRNAPERARRAQNPEPHNAESRAYYATHSAEILAKKKADREANPALFQERNQKRYYGDLEASRAYNRDYAWENRERLRPLARAAEAKRHEADPLRMFLLRQARDQRRKARKYGLPCLWEPTYLEYALRWWDYECAYCGEQVTEGLWHRLHWDHFVALSDPACPGTVPWNLLPTCGASRRSGTGRDVPLCNASKGKLTPEEWLGRMMRRNRQHRLGRGLTSGEQRACKGLVTRKLQKIAAFFQEIAAFAQRRGDTPMGQRDDVVTILTT